MQRFGSFRVLVVLIAGCTLVGAACVSAGTSPDPSASPAFSPSTGPSLSPAFSAAIDANPSPVPSPSPSPSSMASAATPPPSSSVQASSTPGVVTPAPSAPGAAFSVPSLVATVKADVRVRTKPEVSESSALLTPLLPLGTELVVLGGPVAASGYHWYEVRPLTNTLPSGWVAAGSKTGQPWLAARTPACPARPTTFAALEALPPTLGLLCFPRQPITVKARIVPCNCDVDGGWFEPTWFGETSGGPVLIDPAETTASGPDFWLHLDPAAKRPATLPMGSVATITGMFDHPAANDCVIHPYFPETAVAATGVCRLAFAVTEIAP